jgi:tRNA A-37 threonylcarbamoyl transferase component Bud32
MASTGAFRLEDSYRVLKTLGRGGFGEVLLAEQVSLGRKVVIKTIRSALSSDETARARFRREALMVAALRHPNVVNYHDFHEDAAGNLYIVMEYLEGRTLTEHLKERGRLPADEAVPLLTDLCRALEVSHAAGIVHRDLKPSNVLLVGHGEDRRAVLIDFGLLKQIQADESLTAEGLLLGTPTYMAPEQIQAKGVGPWTDLYALGVIAYEMLAGQNPFRTPDLKETVFRHLHHVPRSLSTLGPQVQVSRNLATLIARLLEKDAKKRLQSAEETRRLLKDALSFSERSTYLMTRLPGLKSHRARVLLGVALALAAGGVGADWLLPRLEPLLAHHARPFPPVLAPVRAALLARPQASDEPAPKPRRRLEKELAPRPVEVSTPATAALSQARKAPVRATGRLTVNALPYGNVDVDGRFVGRVPLREVVLPAGRHVVRVYDARFGESVRPVVIQAGKTRTEAFDLRSKKQKGK